MRVELKIWLVRRHDGWVIRYLHPVSQKTKQVATRTLSKTEAERQLGQLRADLVTNCSGNRKDISWSGFRDRYESEKASGLAKRTQEKIDTVFNAIEQILRPKRLGDLTPERISYFQSTLRNRELSESTIAGYLAHLKAALRWAVDMEFLQKTPRIARPRRARSSRLMKGRPITDQEFQSMLNVVEAVIGTEHAENWKHFLQGLWWSGLRLGEAIELHWSDDSRPLIVEVEGDLMIRIRSEQEKGNKDRILAIAPEFAEFLQNTPVPKRTGFVFAIDSRKEAACRLETDRVSKLISRIGKKAEIIVDAKGKKFASAQDLRRAFGERWAERVMPNVLMELMRHESIETTLKYYVGKNSQRTSRILKQAFELAQAKSESGGK
jgi:integrase